VRLESSVAPSILTLSETGMTVPATLTDLRPDRNLSLCYVPNKMTTDLQVTTDLEVLRVMPFSQNQM